MKKSYLNLTALLLVIAVCAALLTSCSAVEAIGSAYQRLLGGGEEDYDIAEAVNTISTELTDSMLTLQVEYYNYTIFGSKRVTGTSLGSAVIIKRDGDTYYAITNAHCVSDGNTAEYRSIYAKDYRGNLIEDVQIYGNSAVSEYYDLALISFVHTKEALDPISLAAESASEGENVFSLGSPHGQSNCLTAGNSLGLFDSELVEFEVIMHDALVGGGSSGGALLDDELKLCGVNFSGEDGKEFGYGGAIPIERVREFLSEYDGFKSL